MADSSLPFYVYVHSRLHSGEPFYVGKGRWGRVQASGGRSEHWKRIVSKDGGRYTSIVAETSDEELSFLVECELIAKYRKAGVELINKTDGGEGASGFRWPPTRKPNPKMTAEQIERRAAAQRGQKRAPLTEECKRNLSISIKAAWANGNRTRKIVKAKKPRKHTEEFKAKMSARLMGNTLGRYKPGEPPRHQTADHIANRMASGAIKFRAYHERLRAEAIARRQQSTTTVADIAAILSTAEKESP